MKLTRTRKLPGCVDVEGESLAPDLEDPSRSGPPGLDERGVIEHRVDAPVGALPAQLQIGGSLRISLRSAAEE